MAPSPCLLPLTLFQAQNKRCCIISPYLSHFPPCSLPLPALLPLSILSGSPNPFSPHCISQDLVIFPCSVGSRGMFPQEQFGKESLLSMVSIWLMRSLRKKSSAIIAIIWKPLSSNHSNSLTMITEIEKVLSRRSLSLRSQRLLERGFHMIGMITAIASLFFSAIVAII